MNKASISKEELHESIMRILAKGALAKVMRRP